MKYLVDANVPGEPTKPAPDPLVVASVRVHERDLNSFIEDQMCHLMKNLTFIITF